MISTILIGGLIGLALSLYSISVERKVQKDENYKAACDLSDTISCTRPMQSTYNKIFGISNSIASALYYLLIITLALLEQQQLLMLVTTAGLAVSAAFAYILYFKIRSLCLICTSLYIVNITLFMLCYFI